ncbi:MAG TPA: HAD family hydrolase [Candidatus Cybelea sp.]|jgi:HAD superfamily hydrolase (TIGR01509 family)|nr:HAD family hydrolase [Candidatus Cybelea sp.]
MEVVRAIGFDLDHTLAIDNRLERVAFLRLLERISALGGRSAGTLADEIDAIDGLLERQRRGDFGIDEAVRIFARDRGVACDDALIEEFRRTALAMVEEFVVPLPGVGRTLERLRQRGIELAVLSNGWDPLQQRKAERAGFAGPVLVSSEIGALKPALPAFQRLLETLGRPARESWYVGDDPHSDVGGAHRAGMTTVWLNWERRGYPTSEAPPQYAIASFDELLELVEEAAA